MESPISLVLSDSKVSFILERAINSVVQTGVKSVSYTHLDQRAAEIMEKLCPERKVITVDARDILTGGGNIHCITQQIPFGKAEQGE